jgi:Fuc2NAc and GlcNAc transferase
MSAALFCILAVAFGLSIAFTGVARAFALRTGMLDHPSARSSHSLPTPRGGGVAIVAAFFLTAAGLVFFGFLDARILILLVGGGGVVAFIGYKDDRRPLSARLRFFVHVSAAAFAVALFGDALPSLAGMGAAGTWITRLSGVLVIAWAINLFNFMDGIDGIAAAEAVFVAGAGAILTTTFGAAAGVSAAMLCLAAASAGFLVWNLPPAKIFMGDAGSGFLGFSLAALGWAASSRGAISIEVWGILAGVFVVDATVTLIRRLVRGDRWFEAHRTHAYQHLARRVGSHLPVTAAGAAINVCWLFPWAWYAAGHESRALLSIVVALLPLAFAAIWAGAGKPEG